MDLGLAGKHALVTGASKGIGLAVTRTLAACADVPASSYAIPEPLRFSAIRWRASMTFLNCGFHSLRTCA